MPKEGFRAPGHRNGLRQGDVSRPGVGMFRVSGREALLPMADGEVSRLRTRGDISPAGDLLLATVPKVGKSTGRNQGSFTSLRAMPWEKVRVPATRSRKSSCIVPSKDCLSNSAAAADANAEQRFWFYRCNSERQRRKREVSSSYGTITIRFCERVGKGRKHAHVIAREEMQKRSFCRRSFPHFFRC